MDGPKVAPFDSQNVEAASTGWMDCTSSGFGSSGDDVFASAFLVEALPGRVDDPEENVGIIDGRSAPLEVDA